jgi:solute carrier family 25 folate transporter 32
MSAPASDSRDLSLQKSSPSTATLLAQRLPKPYINSLCGAAAGVASGIITCPLDVIKTKLQAQGSFRHQQHLQGAPTSSLVYRGLVGTARTIIRQDGLKGMYRGLGPMILGYLPTWAVYMSIYDIAKTNYSERIGESLGLPLSVHTY